MAAIEAPYGVFELDIVGGLRGRAVKMVRGRVTGLPFPANAEIVLEGFVEPDEAPHGGPVRRMDRALCRRRHHGAGARHQGDLSPQRSDPRWACRRWARGRTRWRAIARVLRSATIMQNIANAGVPDVKQVWCHEVGGARMLHAISIKQRYPGHATQAGHIAAQCGASAYASKYIVVVRRRCRRDQPRQPFVGDDHAHRSQGIDPVHQQFLGFAGRPAAHRRKSARGAT